MQHEIIVKELQPLPEGVYEVTVAGLPAQAGGDGDETNHTVRVDAVYLEKLGLDKSAVADTLKRSFTFLLAREPKELILRAFNLQDIARYFPDYEEEISKP